MEIGDCVSARSLPNPQSPISSPVLDIRDPRTDKRYHALYENLVNDGEKFKNGQLFTPDLQVAIDV